MQRPLSIFVAILAAAALLEVAYHFATLGGLAGGDSHYPSAHEVAREAGLLQGPAPPPPPPVQIASSAAPAQTVVEAASSAPAAPPKARPRRRRPAPAPPAASIDAPF